METNPTRMCEALVGLPDVNVEGVGDWPRWLRIAITTRAERPTCPMCAGALVNARVSRLVYGAQDFKAGACGTVYDLVRSPELNHRMDVLGGVREEECRKLLQDFFRERRRPSA